MDAVLFGLLLPGVENHSLGVLRSAAVEAGFDVEAAHFGGWPDLERAARTVGRLRPRWVGMSIQSTEAALVSLTLARLLRGRGYEGGIVCGGHFATLNADDILASPAGVDAVVRFSGEEAFLGLLGGGDDEALARLPGLVFEDRAGKVRLGAPGRVRGPAVVSRPPRQEGLPEHLGFPAADLVVSRGCEARCAYCCVAGASALAARELERANEGSRGPIYTRRGLEQIADEIASLWHDNEARVFNFMDDNVLPLEADECLEWVAGFQAAMARRRVGKIAFSLQVRADAVTEALAAALGAAGLVRAYVGVDGYSEPQLRALGRSAPRDAGRLAVARLGAVGIYSVCNALLLGPTISFEAVCAEIEGLAAMRGAPVHLLPLDVRAGTVLHERARRRGLVEGGFLQWHWRCEDARTALVAEVITSMPTRLAERSVPIALYDLAYNIGIARRLVPSADVSQPAATFAHATAAWNLDQVRLLRAAAALAARRDVLAIRALVAEEAPRARTHDAALLRACDEALTMVEMAIARSRHRPVRAHARGRLLSAIAFGMSLAACGDTSPGGDAHGIDDAAAFDGAAVNASLADALGPDGSGATCPAEAADGGDPRSCPPSTTASPPPSYTYCGDCEDMFEISVDESGAVVDFHSTSGAPLSAELRDCLAEFFRDFCYPSLAGTTWCVYGHCWIA